MKHKLYFLVLLWLSFNFSHAQTKSTISGLVKDIATGEDMIGANVFIQELGTGAATNAYGFYSITIPKGIYRVSVGYVGYESHSESIEVKSDTTINFYLKSESTELQEVVISDRSLTANVDEVKMGTEKLSISAIKKMPSFLGEVDVLKSIQMLPGVQSAGEGTTGYFVRGGTVDQNLVQLDEATVYNASHLMGFFSVFNADAVKDVELFKGGIPAQFGGRLSSVLDIRLKEGNQKDFSAAGGVGTIASRLTVEGPIQKDKSSFMVAGRRTYADLFLKASSDEELKNSKLYFYDLNAKINFKLGERDRLFISGYFGDDVFKYKNTMNWVWGNRTGTMRWNHLFNDKLFANFTLLYSNFNYALSSDNSPTSFEWNASIKDATLKGDFSYFLSEKHNINFGVATTHHRMHPGEVTVTGENFTNRILIDERNAIESALYVSDDIQVSEKLSLQPGFRFSVFNNLGGSYYKYLLASDLPVDTATYSANAIANTYVGIEPRFIARYKLNEKASLKMSYNRMYQYLHLASNTTASFPLDVYVPSSPNVKPQQADQIAVGYFRNFRDNQLEFSSEVFRKFYLNVIDFRDNADLMLNKHIEKEIVSGKGKAYGIELMLKKPEGKLNGWVSYAYSRSFRTIKEINGGAEYKARQDRPHNVNVVLSYQVRERLHLGAAWTYASGMPVTIPASRYVYDGIVVPVYGLRNDHRLPSSHRLDLSLTLDNKKKPGRTWEGSWNFSLFNAYAHKNPFTLQTRSIDDNPMKTEAVQLSIIGTIVPSVTYNFKF